jgi:hypothetical protein
MWTRPDGGVSITHPAIMVNDPPGFTEDDALARAMALLPSTAINPQIIEPADIPADRTFRDALEVSGGALVHNMAKARAIQEDHIRRAQLRRARELLERELIGDDVAADKAAVRAINARNLVNAVSTPEALKATMPASLRLENKGGM